MGYVVEINNSILDLQLETVEEIAADADAVSRFYEALKSWDGTTVLKEILIVRDEETGVYALSAEHDNGSMLFQTWMFANGQDLDPLMTMDLQEGWPAGLIDSGNRVRDLLLLVRSQVGLIRVSVIFH